MRDQLSNSFSFLQMLQRPVLQKALLEKVAVKTTILIVLSKL